MAGIEVANGTASSPNVNDMPMARDKILFRSILRPPSKMNDKPERMLRFIVHRQAIRESSEVEIHLRTDQSALIVGIRNLLLLREERLPFHILPRNILDTKDPALTAGRTVIEQRTPFVIARDCTIRAITIPTSIRLIRSRMLQIRIAIVQTQEQAVVLIIRIRLSIIRDEADILGKVRPTTEYIGFIIINSLFIPSGSVNSYV